MPNLKKLRELSSKMSEEQKKRLLVGLRKLKEIGGETDITYADNLGVNENEFTSGTTQDEPNVISKTFDTEADFENYVNQRRGIEITPKEQQAIISEQADNLSQSDGEEVTVDDKIRITKSITFMDETKGANILADFLEELEIKNQRPIESDKFHIKYELTDSFGINSTIVIKKLKEGGQFCWTAFAKYEHAEDEGKPKPADNSSSDDGAMDDLSGPDDIGKPDKEGPDLGLDKGPKGKK